MNNAMNNTMGQMTNNTSNMDIGGTMIPMSGGGPAHGSMGPGPVKTAGIHGSLEPLVDALKQFERGYLLKALNQCDWQRTRTADMLGISRKTLWQKLKLHRISESEVA